MVMQFKRIFWLPKSVGWIAYPAFYVLLTVQLDHSSLIKKLVLLCTQKILFFVVDPIHKTAIVFCWMTDVKMSSYRILLSKIMVLRHFNKSSLKIIHFPTFVPIQIVVPALHQTIWPSHLLCTQLIKQTFNIFFNFSNQSRPINE